jgi:hypothetical protein
VSESAELEPWQQRALDTIKQYKGREFKVMMSGRGVGKSILNSQMTAYKRMFDDIWVKPIQDLVLSEGTIYGSRYYTVEPVGGSWIDMETWCLDTFGSTGNIWSETKNLTPEPLQRWYTNNRKFWFKELKDRDWFVLRWNS